MCLVFLHILQAERYTPPFVPRLSFKDICRSRQPSKDGDSFSLKRKEHVCSLTWMERYLTSKEKACVHTAHYKRFRFHESRVLLKQHTVFSPSIWSHLLSSHGIWRQRETDQSSYCDFFISDLRFSVFCQHPARVASGLTYYCASGVKSWTFHSS